MSTDIFSTKSETKCPPVRADWVRLFCAIACYGLANYLSGMKFLPGCSFAELRPQIFLPIFMGLYYGPFWGFLTGAGGDSLGYLLAGSNPLPLWHWALANGLMGAIPGVAHRLGIRRVTTLREMQGIYMLLLFATSIPFAFSSAVEWLLGNLAFQEALLLLFLPIFVTDALFAIMIIPLVMLSARLLALTIPTAIFLMTTYLTSLVVLATFAVSMSVVWGSQALAAMEPSDLYAIGVFSLFVIIVGFQLSGWFVRRMTSPLQTLALAADDVAAERYDQLGTLAPLQHRTDELGRLAKAFNIMLDAVLSRETRLKEEVRQLHIEIDHARQTREVNRITGSEYFKTLKNKARDLRLKESDSP